MLSASDLFLQCLLHKQIMIFIYTKNGVLKAVSRGNQTNKKLNALLALEELEPTDTK